ncbi:MAG TPA: hypothetical protein PKC45_12610, partial [Gemmatales bacterium]|nr:hypothetical protein [Gemmatales bacterium]
KIKERLDANTQIMGVMKAMGFDPFKDLTSITVAVSGFQVDLAGGPPRPDAETLIIVRGNFDVAKIEASVNSLVAAGGQERVITSKLGSRNLYEVKEVGEKSMYACFVDGTTMVAGTAKDEVEKAIARHEGRGPATQKKEFTTLLAKADTRQAMWGVISLPESIRTLMQGAPQGEVFEKVEGMTMFVSIKEGVIFELNTFATDAAGVEQIKQMMEQVKQMAGILSLQAQDPESGKMISDIVSGITIGDSERDKVVSLRIEIKGSVFEQIMKRMNQN